MREKDCAEELLTTEREREKTMKKKKKKKQRRNLPLGVYLGFEFITGLSPY